MDEIDLQMLELLQQDGRMTVSVLSQKLALSRPSVSERLHRLQESGVIKGFTARVAPAAVGRTILLFIQISQLRVSPADFEQFIDRTPHVLECHRVTGTVSYFIKAAVASMGSLQAFVDQLIPFGSINTSIVLSTPVEHPIILPESS